MNVTTLRTLLPHSLGQAVRACLVLSLVSLTGLSLVGCGETADVPETAKVTGEVLYNGEPLEGAEVMFHPQGEGNPAHGVTDAEGKFTLATYEAEDGAIPGTHKVTVRYFPEGALPGMESQGSDVNIPQEYATADTTPVTKEVKAGEENNNITIEISSQ